MRSGVRRSGLTAPSNNPAHAAARRAWHEHNAIWLGNGVGRRERSRGTQRGGCEGAWRAALRRGGIPGDRRMRAESQRQQAVAGREAGGCDPPSVRPPPAQHGRLEVCSAPDVCEEGRGRQSQRGGGWRLLKKTLEGAAPRHRVSCAS